MIFISFDILYMQHHAVFVIDITSLLPFPLSQYHLFITLCDNILLMLYNSYLTVSTFQFLVHFFTTNFLYLFFTETQNFKFALFFCQTET